MKKLLYIIVLLPFFLQAQIKKKNVYLIPGQGADYRLYKNLSLDSTQYAVHYIHWQVPSRRESLPEFARTLSAQIDTTQAFYLVGVSLGGMIVTEMNEFLNPEKTIIISSAKTRSELPFGYKMQKYIPLYAIVPKRFMKQSAFVAQPLFEPDRKLEKETCKAMLKAKNPTFVKRTVRMIMKWEREGYNSTIVHIHGDNDNTIPIRNVKYTYLISHGSHMMMLTRTAEIQQIIISEFEK